MTDKDDSNTCICKGNWRTIVGEVEHLIGKRFYSDIYKKEYIFFGIVHGSDDYYYGMRDADGKMDLLSCVGNFESWELTLMGGEDPREETK